MASPFRIFRRNQRIMLAGLTLLAMIAFVLPASTFLGSGRGPATPAEKPAVDVLGRTYADFELRDLVEHRGRLKQFVANLVVKGVQQQFDSSFDNRLINQLAAQQYRIYESQIFGRLANNDEQEFVQTLVLAHLAEQAGMVVTDDAINAVLFQLTSNKLKFDKISQALSEMRTERFSLSESQLFTELRRELLASQYLQTFARGVRTLSPAERFDAFKRVHRFATVELAALNVVDFVDKVPEPTDQQLAEFYEKYRDRIAIPGEPEPGFKRPRRAAFQYFKAEMEYFASKAEVSEEEIQKDYESRKEFEFVEPELPPVEDKKDADKKDSDKKDAENKDSKEEGDKGANGEKSDKGDGEKGTNGAGDDGKKEKSGDDAQEDTSKPDGKGDDGKKDSKEKVSDGRSANRARLPRAGLFASQSVLASFLAPEAPAASAPAKDAAGSAAKPAAENAGKANATEPPPLKPDDSAPKDQPDAKSSNEKDEPSKAGGATAKPAEAPDSTKKPSTVTKDDKSGDKASAKPAPRKYLPLEKVRAQIVKELKQRKARDVIEKVMNDLQLKVNNYNYERLRYESRRPAGDNTPYKPFPLADLAQANGLGAYETRFVSKFELGETELGKSYQSIQPAGSRFPQPVPFTSTAFDDSSMQPYVPVTTNDNLDDTFLVWKTKELGEEVLPLEQIRKRVADAWKMIQARGPARKSAEDHAAAVRKAGGRPFKQLFGGDSGIKVLEPPRFTWLTRGAVPSDDTAPLRTSEIEGVDGVSLDLLESVFSLAPSEVGVATNHAQSKVYVIRLNKYEPLDPDLRKDFANTEPKYYLGAAGIELARLRQAWIERIEREGKVRWHHNPLSDR